MSSAAHRKTHTTTTGELIGTLVAECRNPERLIELYYWSTEPELLMLIRKLASLSREAREQLELLLWPEDAASGTAEAENAAGARLMFKGRGAEAAGERPRRRRHN
jgi:hypothetical protein